MRLLGILLCLVVSGCNCDPTQLQRARDPKCGNKCYTLDAGSPGKGACSYGEWACDEQGNETECVGQTGPSDEVCDRIDNDCNGQIDEYLSKCCSNPAPETCNGIDDDCDGTVDNLPVQICYHAANETLAYSPCRPGVTRCIGGLPKCDGEVVPHTEICDGLDNDCDGQIDENLSSTESLDIVFIIDNSGSMGDKIGHVQNAVNVFSAMYVNHNEIRWGLVGAPGPVMAIVTPYVITPMGDVRSFQAGVGTLSDTGTGLEPTLDALWQVCNPLNPLGLRWMTPNRRIVFFSDEEPQSYATPGVTAKDVANMCRVSGIPVYAFVLAPASLLNTGYMTIVNDTNGKAFEITSKTLENDLETLISEVACR